MGICHFNLITKPLDKLCVVHSFRRTPLPLPPSLIFMASLPRYQKTYLLSTISLEYSATVKKNPKFPSILKSHWKSSLRPFLHWALQLLWWLLQLNSSNSNCLGNLKLLRVIGVLNKKTRNNWLLWLYAYKYMFYCKISCNVRADKQQNKAKAWKPQVL